MRSLLIAALASASILLHAKPADARVVEYDLDKAAIEAAAQEQGIDGPFSDNPAGTPYPIWLEAGQAADHDVKILSIYCQAYKVENPISTLMGKLVAPAVAQGEGLPQTGPRSGLTIRMKSGLGLFRCLGSGELKVACKNEVRLTAEAVFQSGDGKEMSVPLAVRVERNGRVGGFCGHMARFTSIVSREAGIQLIAQARASFESQVKKTP